jgi:hypothetical protein
MLGGCINTLGLPVLQVGPQSSPKGLEAARRYLRGEQAKAAASGGGGPYARRQNTTEEALYFLHKQRQFISTDDPNILRRGVFRFDRKAEGERMRRAEELIRRVQPGPFEDPNYFAFIAYEAASIEMALPRHNGEFSRLLLGTVHNPFVDASSNRTEVRGYTIVQLHSGLIDFMYQSAKAVVEAMHPVLNPDKTSFVIAPADMDEVRARLKVNDAPVNRVYRTVESYFFNGYPRAFENETLVEEQLPVLEVLVWMAERWAVAHEYGHGTALGRDFGIAPNPSWAEEFYADLIATILTVLSAWSLDHLPPEQSLSGANFTLACLDVLRRGYSVVTTGREVRDEGSATHPPHQFRAQRTIDVFRQFFDVHYTDRGKVSSLDLVVRKQPPAEHAFGKEQGEGVYFFSNVLFEIWSAVKERLTLQYRDKRPLHSMWR